MSLSKLQKFVAVAAVVVPSFAAIVAGVLSDGKGGDGLKNMGRHATTVSGALADSLKKAKEDPLKNVQEVGAEIEVSLDTNMPGTYEMSIDGVTYYLLDNTGLTIDDNIE